MPDQGSSRASAGQSPGSPDPVSEPEDSSLAQLLVERTDEFIVWISADARLLYGNPAMCRALGYSAAELSALCLVNIAPGIQENWPARLEELKQSLTQTFVAELHTRSGETIPVQFTATYIGGKEFVLCCGRVFHGTGRNIRYPDDLAAPPPSD
jgi:PAS domain S-box-containing protein